MKKLSTKSNFIFGLSVFAVILFLYNLSDRVNSYNATMLSFSYKYGLIPRGLLGSIYQGLNNILPFDMNTYSAVNLFVLIETVIYVVLILAFAAFITRRSESDNLKCLIVFFVIFAVPTFSGYYNFGRVDMYLVLISMLAVVLVCKDKFLWLLPIMGGVGVLLHEGYVFMYANVILVLLVYRTLTKADRESNLGSSNEKNILNKKYLLVFIISFLVVSALFLFFRLHSIDNAKEAYDEIYSIAKGMCYKGKPHKDVIRAEILGVDLTSEEVDYHIQNLKEFPIFLILFSPFIGILIGFLRRLIKSAQNIYTKLAYIAVAAGALTTLPLFIMKVDYGRWCFAVVMYYCFMIMALHAMGDKNALTAWEQTLTAIREKCSWAKLLLAYAILFTPFTDLAIGKFSYLILTLPEKLAGFIG